MIMLIKNGKYLASITLSDLFLATKHIWGTIATNEQFPEIIGSISVHVAPILTAVFLL